MNDTDRKTLSYSEKLGTAADRLARRMGGQFVRDSRWDNLVKAAENAASPKR